MAKTRRIRGVNLMMGFAFKKVFGDDPELCRELLEVTLDMEVAEIDFVQPEREFEVTLENRAGRVDLFVVDERGNRFDVEVQAANGHDEHMRARHYQSLMDMTQLRRGTKASELRDSVVVFICGFDPFGDSLRVYDCQMTCLRTGRLLGDGRRSVFLYTRGTAGDVSPRLSSFLALMNGEEVDSNPFVEHICNKVDVLVGDPEWMEQYMTLEEEMERWRAAAKEQGLAEGRERGLAEGRERGLAEGRERGLAEGRKEGALEIVASLVASGDYELSVASARFGIPESQIREAIAKS